MNEAETKPPSPEVKEAVRTLSRCLSKILTFLPQDIELRGAHVALKSFLDGEKVLSCALLAAGALVIDYEEREENKKQAAAAMKVLEASYGLSSGASQSMLSGDELVLQIGTGKRLLATSGTPQYLNRILEKPSPDSTQFFDKSPL